MNTGKSATRDSRQTISPRELVMTIRIQILQPKEDCDIWDLYVRNHPEATLYHLSGWKNVIENTYGHNTYYLVALKNELETGKYENSNPKPESISFPSLLSFQPQADRIAGILPLVHIKHFLFGNTLVSMPYFDLGGILADDEETEKALLTEAINLAQELKVKNIELRHTVSLSWLKASSQLKVEDPSPFGSFHSSKEDIASNSINPNCATKSHKVRMLLDLTGSSAALMKSFKSKLRSQINRAIKEGLKVKAGGAELVDEFYEVFSENMRDLGSPVHAKQLVKNVMTEFSDQARILLVHKAGLALAAALTVGFNGTLENPWASALRRYSRLSPNMLLYWGMLDYAAQNGFARFDFGRCTPGEGTFKFKEQWGARPESLHWQYIGWGNAGPENGSDVRRRFELAAAAWKCLPLAVTRNLGPSIRKYISL